jgi:hypothetical protein
LQHVKCIEEGTLLAFREEKGVKLCVECAGGEMDVRIELRRP